MITAVSLSTGYRGRPVLASVSLSVRSGELVAVIGPNASGKTTLLKTLASLLKPLAGAVYIDGSEASRIGAQERARRVGLVLTEQPRGLQLTVFEVVALGRYPHTGLLATLTGVDRREVMRALQDVGLAGLAGRRFSELSDGQRQKVMIARALAQEPRVLILDEPVTFLDPRARIEVLKTIWRVCRERGVAVIASLHEVELALRMADRLVVVDGGGVEVYDSPEDFAAAGGLSSLYGMGPDLSFSPHLMSLELSSVKGGPRVFVIAGGGSGALTYRLLARLGYSFSTGVLHGGDVDCLVAETLGGKVVAERPFHPISPETIERALGEALTCGAAVYTSPPLGPFNEVNARLAEKIAACGVPLIILGGAHIRGASSRVESYSELSQALYALLGKAGQMERAAQTIK